MFGMKVTFYAYVRGPHLTLSLQMLRHMPVAPVIQSAKAVRVSISSLRVRQAIRIGRPVQ
jgi:hypothetical protein